MSIASSSTVLKMICAGVVMTWNQD